MLFHTARRCWTGSQRSSMCSEKGERSNYERESSALQANVRRGAAERTDCPDQLQRSCNMSYRPAVQSTLGARARPVKQNLDSQCTEARMATGGIEASSPTIQDPFSCLAPASWAEGLVVSSTGLTAKQRDSVRAAVQAGGGRLAAP